MLGNCKKSTAVVRAQNGLFLAIFTIAMTVAIVGALVWLVVGVAHVNFVDQMDFHSNVNQKTGANIVYVLVGLFSLFAAIVMVVFAAYNGRSIGRCPLLIATYVMFFLVFIGNMNWLTIGISSFAGNRFDFVKAIFGEKLDAPWANSVGSSIVFSIVGASGVALAGMFYYLLHLAVRHT